MWKGLWSSRPESTRRAGHWRDATGDTGQRRASLRMRLGCFVHYQGLLTAGMKSARRRAKRMKA